MAPPRQPVTSPESGAGSSDGQGTSLNPSEVELQRKRARDRKSQQAMRDRTKWTIANLTEQVAFLTQVLDQRTRDSNLLDTRVRMLETENAHLRTQNAALQLSLLGSHEEQQSPRPAKNVWEIAPCQAPPDCLSDQILHGFLSMKRLERPESRGVYPPMPDMRAVLDKDYRSGDDISTVIGDIVRSYAEIDALPQRIAAFVLTFLVMKWVVVLDKESWDMLPPWMKPTAAQISTPHPAWIDRIPWPKARDYLIAHPAISLDDFAAVYSTSFCVSWPYDPSSVIMTAEDGAGRSGAVTINPVFEEHMRQIKNWTVGKPFREKWPELGRLIDSDSSAAPSSFV